MEFVLFLAILGLLVVGVKRRKKAEEYFKKLPEKEKQRIIKEEQIKKQQADELITVILPTIKNDK